MGLNRPSLLLALEPRMMFDGAGVATADAAVDAVPIDAALPAPESTATEKIPSTPPQTEQQTDSLATPSTEPQDVGEDHVATSGENGSVADAATPDESADGQDSPDSATATPPPADELIEPADSGSPVDTPNTEDFADEPHTSADKLIADVNQTLQLAEALTESSQPDHDAAEATETQQTKAQTAAAANAVETQGNTAQPEAPSANSADQSNNAEQSADVEPDALVASGDTAVREVVFVDTGVVDYEILLTDLIGNLNTNRDTPELGSFPSNLTSQLTPHSGTHTNINSLITVEEPAEHSTETANPVKVGATASRTDETVWLVDDVQIVLLDQQQNGIEQIRDALTGLQGITGVHIVSHGAKGAVKLGNTWLTNDSLSDYSADVADWGRAFDESGDLLFYGCDLATNDSGKTLVDAIQKLTGTDVAASIDDTGSAALDGNWNLEYRLGEVDTDVVFSATTQQSWSALLNTFTVTNTNDSGAGSFRQAIIDANALAGTDTIEFNITGGGVQTISLGSALPGISETVFIDGWSEPGFAGTPVIRIDGVSAGGSVNGLTFSSNSDNSTLRGLMITNFGGDGVHIDSGADNINILGNWIGTTGTGSTGVGNGGSGVSVLGDNVTIGGSGTHEANVITNNAGNGVFADGANPTIAGNYIGVDPDGASGVGNGGDGIVLGSSAVGADIGGSSYGEGNVISNNDRGIFTQANNVVIRGNYIGTDSGGTLDRGNSGAGIVVNGGTNGTIGGLGSGDENLIAYNSTGIEILNAGHSVLGNTIHDQTQQAVIISADTSLVANVIYANGSSGSFDSILVNSGSNTIYHNTIHGASANGIEINSGNTTIRNNIITGSANYGLANFGGSITESHNLVTDAVTNPANLGGRANFALNSTTINADPNYTDASGGDFRLQSSSPAIDSGLDLGASQPDVNGSAPGDFDGAAPDMGGAGEYSDIASPSSVLTDEDTALVFSGANLIAIEDTVSNSTEVRMSLDVGNGVLTLASTTGITFVQGSNGSTSMVIQGTKSNVNNALDGLSFDPNQDYNGPDTLDMQLYIGPDLISAYAFEGGSGTDSVGGNNGTVNGATTIAGADGDALSFDEVNDHVRVPDFAIGNEFTISFNMKIDDNSGSLFQYLYSHGNINNANSINVFLVEDSHGSAPNILRTVVRDTNDSLDNFALEFDVSSIIGDGQWHTYTLTVASGTGSRVYLDGALRNTDSRGGDSFNPTTDLYLGAREDLDVDRYYGGGLDNVQIYNSALSDGEVSDLHDVGNAAQSVDITVKPVNDPPTVSLSNTTTVLAEDTDTSSRVKVADIVVSDIDAGTNTLSLSGADASLFEIDGTELFIQAGASLDFETNPTLDVTVEVDDASVGATPDDTATLAISITDVNEPPSVSLSNATNTLPEDTDTSSRVKVADIVVTDDALGTNTLSLSGTDAALFEIIGTELFIQAGTSLDFETNPTLDVTVEVDDTSVGATPDDTAALAISITDVNEPPSVSLANTTTTLPEDTDTSSRVKVADIVVTDDALGTNNLSLSGADAALFEIIGTELFIQAGTTLDFETNPTLNVTVEIDDTAVGSTPDDTASLAISITNVNEPPSVSLANTTTALSEDADTSSRIKVADIVVTDDALGSNALSLSGTDAALFEIIGTELFIQAGTSLDFETNPTLDVTVEVDDISVGATPDDTAALAITITDVNEPPSVSLANTTTTLPEDTDTSSRVKVADIVVTDDALGTNNLSLSGTDAALFEIIGTELFIQAGTALDFETNPTLDVTVEVDDTGVGSTPDDTAALAITITDVNEPPSVSLANTTTTLPEDTDTSSRVKVADIVVTDDALGTNNLSLSGVDAALFEIIGTELFIQAGTSLDFETNPSLDVTVEVDDTAVGSTPDDTAALAIAITDVNEPPSVSLANATTTLPEDTDTSSRVKVADIVVTDDALGTNNLSLSGTDAALFEIVGTELFIQAGTALDFETNPNLDVTVEVDDTGVGSTPDDTAALAITITDVNEPPSVSLANTTTTLPEDADTSSRVKVADIVVTDDAIGTNALALSGADAALFEIIGTELFIQAGTSLDFETNPSLDVTVEVDDTAVGSTPDDTAALAISITDVNEPPTVSLANATTTLPEDIDTSSRVKVADIVVTDDALGTNNLSLSGADAALFEIIGTELFIQAGTGLDFETNPTLDVTVEVDDTAVGSTPDDTAALAISITDVNEPPSVSLANTTTTLPEDTDTSSRVKVADIVITDDALGTNTLSLSGADAALFEIIGTELFIQAGTTLDFETNPNLDVTVEVNDTTVGSTPDDTTALAISITDVNEPPSVSLANTTTTLPEDTDTSSRVKVADIVITDDALGTNTLSLSGTDAALFEVIGTELFIQAGTVLDFETNPTLDVTVEVDDTAVGSTPDDTAALAITITDVNEPPSVSLANTTTTLPEDTDTSSRVKVADIVVTDDALGTNNLSLSGADAALFEIIGTELFIQAGTTLDFETNPILDVTVEVDDTALGSTPDDTSALAITITDANEPPSVSLANTTTTLAEDTDTSSRIKVADIIITDDAIGTNTLSLSGADAALFEIIGTELFIRAGSALDFETNPTLDVTVEVDDTAVGSTPDDTAALAISITDVNEPPTVSLANATTTLTEDTDTSSQVKIADIVITDDALGTNTLSLSGADAALFEIIGTELFIQAGTALDFETNPTLDVTVEVDDTAVGSTPDDTTALAISITDVNEPPTVSLVNATNTLPEDTDTSSRVKVADIVVTDDALGTNNLSLSGADAALFEIVGTELFIQAGSSLDFETNPTLDVTVEVDDTSVGATPDDTAALAITITDVNEPPIVSLANTTTTLPEDTDTSSRIKVADIVVTDDALGTNTLSLSGADAALFEIIGNELFIQAGTALDFETNPTLDVTVEVDDTTVGATPDDTAALAISITDVNEPPSVSLTNTTTTLPENTDTSSRVKVADIVVTDDALGTNTLSLSGADAALFEILGNELFIQAGTSLDFETNPNLDVTVEVDDTAVGSTPDDTAVLAIAITDVNEPPSVSLANTTTTLPEDTDTSSRVKVADIVITDDALGTNTLSLSGTDAALFEIIGNELFIQAGSTLDFETNPTLDVTVEVDDTAVGSTPDDTAALAIAISDVNEPPSVSLANTTTTLPEDTDTSSRVKVADIVITDDALGTNTLSLSGADAALFEIIGNELFIQAGAALDFETNPSLDVTVEVDDTAVGSTPDDTAALAIAITDVNEPPSVSLTNTTTTLPEDTDTSSRVKVADIIVTDDALGTNNLSLSGADAALFEIIGTELYIQAGAALDFETNPTLDVTVEVDDTAVGSTPDDTAALAISITDINEPPSVSLANTTTTLPEDTDTSSRVKVADIVVTDDALGTNNLSLSGTDAVLFEIIGTELFIQAGATLDFETNPNLDVTVQVDDTTIGSTPDDTAALAISITDVNESPTVRLVNVVSSLSENTDTSSAIKFADIVITDDDLGTNVLFLTGADADNFEIVGNELFLRAGSSIDFETKPILEVIVNVDDNTITGTPNDSVTLSINITDVNEPAAIPPEDQNDPNPPPDADPDLSDANTAGPNNNSPIDNNLFDDGGPTLYNLGEQDTSYQDQLADQAVTSLRNVSLENDTDGNAVMPSQFNLRGFAEGLFFKPYLGKLELLGFDPNVLPVLSLSNPAMPPISTLHIPAALFDMLDQLRSNMDHSLSARDTESFDTLTVAISSTVALSVGYVAWLLRLGALAAAVASLTPIWREFDPLPILASRRTKDSDRDKRNQNPRDSHIDQLFENSTGRA